MNPLAIEVSEAQVQVMLGEKAASMEQVVLDWADYCAATLLMTIQEKLSGEVLHIRSGDLIRSLVLNAAQVTGLGVQSSVEIPKTSEAWIYGMAHEYGGTGFYEILPKQADLLAFVAGGEQVFARRVNHPPAKERSYMRSSLLEKQEDFFAELQAMVAEVIAA